MWGFVVDDRLGLLEKFSTWGQVGSLSEEALYMGMVFVRGIRGISVCFDLSYI